MRLLTRVLRECGRVDRAYIARNGCCWYIWVEPYHLEFWESFKIKFPVWSSNVLRYRTRVCPMDGVACPEFDRVEDLISWLTETMGLPDGFKRLLMLDAGFLL